MKYEKILTKLLGQGNLVTIHKPVLSMLEGDYNTAVFLEQLCYWTPRSKDGWIYKSAKNWEDELFLSRYKIDKARNILTKKGIIETKLSKANGVPTTYYKVNLENLNKCLYDHLQMDLRKTDKRNEDTIEQRKNTDHLQMDLRKTDISICEKLTNGNAKNLQMEMQKTCKSYTENTAENTQRVRTEKRPTEFDLSKFEDFGIELYQAKDIFSRLEKYKLDITPKQLYKILEEKQDWTYEKIVQTIEAIYEKANIDNPSAMLYNKLKFYNPMYPTKNINLELSETEKQEQKEKQFQNELQKIFSFLAFEQSIGKDQAKWLHNNFTVPIQEFLKNNGNDCYYLRQNIQNEDILRYIKVINPRYGRPPIKSQSKGNIKF